VLGSPVPTDAGGYSVPAGRLGRPLRTQHLDLLALLLANAAFGQLSHTTPPETVQIRSGTLHLKTYFWGPAGSHPFPAVLFNNGSRDPNVAHTHAMPITAAAERLEPIFLKRGYALL
jgi:hypothetical protein